MADSKELQNQLNIQQQINKVLADRQKVLSSQASQISSQTKMYIEMCNAMNCEDLEGVSSRLDDIVSGLNSASDAAQQAADAQDEISRAAEEGADAAEKQGGAWSTVSGHINASTGAAVGFGSGAVKAFKGAAVEAQMMASTVSSAASALANVGASIISLPFKMLGGLTKMATAGGGGASAWAQELEKVRGEFGSLASGEGKAVMDMYDNMTASGNALSDTGISLTQVFGAGSGGMAAALAFVGEMAKEAGAQFHMLKDSMAANASQLAVMNKGLGMTNAALVEMTKKAQLAGKDVGAELHAITSMSLDMADQFGVSAKTIGTNVSAMVEDVENFGNMSKKQLVATATYMAKLGLEAKDLQGVIGKFDDFEGAADSVSQLNQAFGIQLDTMEMMNAENPAERIDMMRDAFHSAGKSVEDMTRQEKALLAEQTGLSVSAMENAFAAENQGVSYEDMEAAAGEAEEQQMTQEEAMSKLADSIEKTFGSGSGTIDGFFSALTQGFMKGLTQSEEFRAVMKKIREALKVVYQFGKQLGKMFSELMGDLGVWEGLKDLFDPKDLKNLLGINEKGGLTGTGLLGIFKKFKDALSGKGTYSPQQMADDMGKEFGKFFSAKGPAFSKLKDAFFKGIQMIGTVITGLIPWVVQKMVDMLKGLADKIRNPPDMGGDGFLSSMIGMFEDMFTKLVALAPQLLAAVLDLISAVFEKHGATIMKFGSIYLGIIFTKMMIAAALSSLKGAIIGKIAGLFSKALGGITKKVPQPDPPPGAEKGGFLDGLKSFVKNISELSAKDILMAGAKLFLLSLSFIPALAALAGGLVLVTMILSAVPFGQLIKALVGTVGALIAMKLMMEITGTISGGTIGKAMVGAVLGAAFLAVGMVAFALAMGLAAMAVNAVGLGNMVKVAIAMAFTAMAAIALALMVIPMALLVADGGTTVGLAFLGAILGAAFLAVGLFGFAIAMGIAAGAVNKVGLANFALVAAAMVFTAIAAVALTIAAVALAAGLVLYPLGALGAVASALMFLAMGAVMLPAMSAFYSAMSGIGFGEIAIALGSAVLIALSMNLLALALTVGIALFVLGAVGALAGALFLATLIPFAEGVSGLGDVVDAGKFAEVALAMVSMTGVAVAAALLGVALAYGIIPMLVGILGVPVASAFIGTIAENFAPKMEELGKALPSDMGSIAKRFLLLGAVFLTTVVMAAAATGMVIFLLPWIKKMAMKGFKVTGELMMSIVEHFGPAIEAIAGMKVADPAKVEAIVNAIAGIMEALGGATDVVAKIALLDAFSSSSGNEGSLLEGAKDFMDSIFKGMTGLIKTLAKMVSKMKEGDIKKLESIGGVIGAIGKLMVALQPPPELFEMMSSMSGGTIGGLLGRSAGIDIKGIMGSYGEVIGDILAAVKDSIVGLIKDLLKIEIGKDPEAAKAKAEVIGLMVKAAVDMATGFGELAAGVMKMNEEQQPLFGSGPTVKETMTSYKDTLAMIFEAVGDGIPLIVTSLMAAADSIVGDPEVLKPKMELIVMAMNAVNSFASAIGAMSSQIPEPGWFESSEDVLEEFMTTVDAIMGIAAEWIPVIVNSLMSANIDGSEAALTKMTVIAQAMDVISQFGDILGEWTGWDAASIYDTYGPVLKGIAWLFGYESDGVGKTVPELLNTLGAIVVPGGLQKKVTGLASALEAIGGLANELIALPDPSSALTNVMNTGLAVSWLTWMLKGIGEFKVPKGLTKKTEKIAAATAVVGDMMMNTVATLSVSETAIEVINTTSDVMVALAEMFTRMGDFSFPDPGPMVQSIATGVMAMIPIMMSLKMLSGQVDEGMFETIGSLEEMFSPASDGFLGIFGGKPTLDGLFGTIEDMSFSPESVSKVMALAAGTAAIVQTIVSMMGVAAMMEALGGDAIEGMVTSVVESIDHLSAIGEAFASLPEISLQTAVDNFVEAVALETSQFTVNQGPLNIIINLEVSMDAQKVGKVLTNKSVMTTPLATVEGG